MMNKYLLFLTIFFLQCELTGEPTYDPLVLSNMEISYRRYGGWSNTLILNISNTGNAEALSLSHGSQSVLDSSSMKLSEDQKTRLEWIFAPFSDFESYYGPSEYYTDGDAHVIILEYNSKPDTVFVYEPENSIIPYELNLLINDLTNLWESMLLG